MVVYLAQKYYINTLIFVLAFVVFPLLLWGDLSYLVPKAIFWGGLFGGVYTFYEFRKKNLWPLYDNLRYSRYLLIAGMFLSLQVVTFIVTRFS